jgi:hypothetical protein
MTERCIQLEEVQDHQIIIPKTFKLTAPPDDEGISSSDQPSSGEENGSPPTRRRDVIELKVEGPPSFKETNVDQQESEDETTIEEVMEELRNIIHDAESEDRARLLKEQGMNIAKSR